MKVIVKTAAMIIAMAAFINTAFCNTKDPNYRVPMGKVTHMELKEKSVQKTETTKTTTKTESTTTTVTPKTETKTETVTAAKTVNTEQDKEYLKSIGNLNISKDKFEEDKSNVLAVIKELENIMKTRNYDEWVKYIDAESIEYWQNTINLKKLQARLPNKNIVLKNLKDYFNSMFIPSRQNRSVTEIRYITDVYVKAVEAQEDKDTVFYYFNKINGQWKVHIPPL